MVPSMGDSVEVVDAAETQSSMAPLLLDASRRLDLLLDGLIWSSTARHTVAAAGQRMERPQRC
jgi:hypothetical protein